MTSANFAAAQARVLERRQQRDAEARNNSVDPRTRLPPAIRNLPYPLHRATNSGFALWDTIKGREGTRPAFRVGQVDAELLDEELLGLLKGQVGEGLKYFGRHMREDWSHEIELALRAILFKLSIWDHNASYGAALQNLKYTDSRSKGPVYKPPTKWQKVLYGLLTVGGRYAWDKWDAWMIDQEGGYDEPSPTVKSLAKLSNAASTVHSMAALVSFLVFLINGRYRTLVDRLLRMRLTPPSMQVSREVSFEYLNRQLVWHAFTEFLLFLLPLVGIGRWRRWLSRAWKKTVSSLRVKDEGDEDAKNQGPLGFLPERTCAICYQEQNPTASSESDVMAVGGASGGIIGSAQTDITNPYEAIPCGCIYCFACIAQKLEAEEGEGWMCLRCGEIVKQCKPWNGDVLEETRPHSSSGKNVGFVTAQKTDPNAQHTDESTAESSNMWATIERDETDDTSVGGETDHESKFS
ncbi:Peroxisome assembly protein CAR1, putative [Coccidioides posadasii C735 delta SOWgp]|uniref:Peroxisome biosynthesis protein Peroxin-2 n=3 Tax=Coccidioides posadasii TaxID=199306 RepID=E9D9E2_COCPS|nr:Peroxisome assembly protein CAR1, putative [Coccidioides posadasii C735 delta SOWgp]EER29522.1 Peroxisome assembly protein CAR1, putative [Coccidioides posadasii C735 delta SOWgp]EFW17176.1 peroxisome biosynthesis protein Peroxin-2 [Coccidioides posadasii str. Silveira]|eukprot:XP_003071667.1 Peroxisome assembly protein CAR1, putative [Coccidioides posadasii C735 delta SOWgp]